MIYWIFKHYMKKLIEEYAEAYDTESRATSNQNMRPDLYWLQRYLEGDFEWAKDERGDYVRRSK